MENDNCIIVKRKDYNELVEKASEPKSDKIDVSWEFNYRYHSYSKYWYLNDKGTINLEQSIYYQISRICKNLHKQFDVRVKENLSLVRSEVEYEMRLEFSKLSLWDRIFFKY